MNVLIAKDLFSEMVVKADLSAENFIGSICFVDWSLFLISSLVNLPVGGLVFGAFAGCDSSSDSSIAFQNSGSLIVLSGSGLSGKLSP